MSFIYLYFLFIFRILFSIYIDDTLYWSLMYYMVPFPHHIIRSVVQRRYQQHHHFVQASATSVNGILSSGFFAVFLCFCFCAFCIVCVDTGQRHLPKWKATTISREFVFCYCTLRSNTKNEKRRKPKK